MTLTFTRQLIHFHSRVFETSAGVLGRLVGFDACHYPMFGEKHGISFICLSSLTVKEPSKLKRAKKLQGLDVFLLMLLFEGVKHKYSYIYSYIQIYSFLQLQISSYINTYIQIYIYIYTAIFEYIHMYMYIYRHLLIE